MQNESPGLTFKQCVSPTTLFCRKAEIEISPKQDILAGKSGCTILQTVHAFRLAQFFEEFDLLPRNFGFALFGAWNFLVFFSSIVTGGYQEFAVSNNAFSITSGISNACAFAFVAMLGERIAPLYSKSRIGLGLALCAGVGTVLAGLGPSAGLAHQESALVAGGILTGVGSAWVIVCWGEYFSTLGGFRVTACVLCSYGIAFVLYFLIVSLPHVAGLVACGFLLPLSWRFARASAQTAEPLPLKRTDSAKQFFRQTWRVIFALFVFGTAFWLFVATATPTDNASYTYQFSISLLGTAMLVVAFCVVTVLLRKRFSLSLIYRLVLPLTIVGFMLIFALDPQANGVGFAFAMSAFTCLDIFLMVVLCDVSHTSGFLPSRAVSIGRFFEGLCGPAGIVIGAFGLPIVGVASSEILVLLAVVCILVIASTVVFGSGGIFVKDAASAPVDEGPHAPVASAMQFARQCDAAIERYGLSERESEILLMVSRGRSVPYISERLHIATSTTKTHIKSTYIKMGVAGRQEMLDLIERIDPVA
ncbi:helix-turn-helix domain-containing protein [Arabiibacter massiliensis]|uniref:helix-turn-helix domain-containing protein n=1 Tax=Arabiibacter massiliensis TaxID=1870985 RepID=UPI00155AA5B6|nr:helix-turn-helix transcriptional regulator [Arabiibacter massiliensis]